MGHLLGQVDVFKGSPKYEERTSKPPNNSRRCLDSVKEQIVVSSLLGRRVGRERKEKEHPNYLFGAKVGMKTCSGRQCTAFGVNVISNDAQEL